MVAGWRGGGLHPGLVERQQRLCPAGDGSTPERLLARLDRQVQEVDWTPDGRWLVLRTDNGAAGAGDLIGIRTSGDTAPVPLVESNFTELHPAVSPDGHWLAYTSNESGTNEVYVRPFPATTGARWQVSNGGGMQPRWAADGRELFYLDGTGRLVAAQIRRRRHSRSPAFGRCSTLPVRGRRLPSIVRSTTGAGGFGSSASAKPPRLLSHSRSFWWRTGSPTCRPGSRINGKRARAPP